jgi:hypothetical protein
MEIPESIPILLGFLHVFEAEEDLSSAEIPMVEIFADRRTAKVISQLID